MSARPVILPLPRDLRRPNRRVRRILRKKNYDSVTVWIDGDSKEVTLSIDDLMRIRIHQTLLEEIKEETSPISLFNFLKPDYVVDLDPPKYVRFITTFCDKLRVMALNLYHEEPTQFLTSPNFESRHSREYMMSAPNDLMLLVRIITVLGGSISRDPIWEDLHLTPSYDVVRGHWLPLDRKMKLLQLHIGPPSLEEFIPSLIMYKFVTMKRGDPSHTTFCDIDQMEFFAVIEDIGTDDINWRISDKSIGSTEPSSVSLRIEDEHLHTLLNLIFRDSQINDD